MRAALKRVSIAGPRLLAIPAGVTLMLGGWLFVLAGLQASAAFERASLALLLALGGTLGISILDRPAGSGRHGAPASRTSVISIVLISMLIYSGTAVGLAGWRTTLLGCAIETLGLGAYGWA
jgi:hypothetical protein